MSTLKPYDVCFYNQACLVILSLNNSIPYINDQTADEASGIGVDITDPNSYQIWDDACLCWDVLQQTHVFHNPRNLINHKLENYNDGYIPFDHATSRLKAVLSLLKFSQEKLYKEYIFETKLPLTK